MRGRRLWSVTAPLAGVLAAALLAGCSAGSGRPAAGTATATAPARTAVRAVKCGTTQTAAGVPVEIEVTRGHVACGAALTVERDYARELASGAVPGNGGGAPVTIRGWVCQGFNTPTVLATGKASACHRRGSELLALLPPTSQVTPAPAPS